MTITKTKNCFTGPLDKTLTDDELYNYFIQNIYYGNLKINGIPVAVFETPFEDNRMQGYFHLTTKTQKQFNMKIRMKEPRAYYINHVAPMINNFLNCKNCDNEECSKIKVWTKPYKNTKRTKLLYTNDMYSYIVILERHKNKVYIVTSYLIDEPNYLEKILSEYNKYKKDS